jgi:hypothetical protein
VKETDPLAIASSGCQRNLCEEPHPGAVRVGSPRISAGRNITGHGPGQLTVAKTSTRTQGILRGDFHGVSWMAASPSRGTTGRAGDVLRVPRTATATGGSLGERVARGSGAAGALRCRPPGRGGRRAPSERGAVRVQN